MSGLFDVEKKNIDELIQELEKKKQERRVSKTNSFSPPPKQSLQFQGRILFIFYLLVCTSIAGYHFLHYHNAKHSPPRENISDLHAVKKEKSQALIESQKIFVEKKPLLEQLVKKKPFYQGILKELSLITPPEIVFSKLSVLKTPSGQYSITCEATLPKQHNTQEILKIFVKKMVYSPFFSKVALEGVIENTETKEISFTLRGTIIL